MEYIGLVLVAALVFGVCFLVDKSFTKAFRGAKQHQSGLSVRLSKRYGSFGAILIVLGIAALFTGLPDQWTLIGGGAVVLVTGMGLVIYYLGFGIFYDDETFLYSAFGKKKTVYRYGQIRSQQLFTNGKNLIIELYMDDGTSVTMQSGMSGVELFLDKAFSAWLEQTGRRQEDCAFYDPTNNSWFPPVEE